MKKIKFFWYILNIIKKNILIIFKSPSWSLVHHQLTNYHRILALILFRLQFSIKFLLSSNHSAWPQMTLTRKFSSSSLIQKLFVEVLTFLWLLRRKLFCPGCHSLMLFLVKMNEKILKMFWTKKFIDMSLKVHQKFNENV